MAEAISHLVVKNLDRRGLYDYIHGVHFVSSVFPTAEPELWAINEHEPITLRPTSLKECSSLKNVDWK